MASIAGISKDAGRASSSALLSSPLAGASSALIEEEESDVGVSSVSAGPEVALAVAEDSDADPGVGVSSGAEEQPARPSTTSSAIEIPFVEAHRH